MELIDRNAFDFDGKTITQIVEMIYDAPAIGVAVVVHGKWIDKPNANVVICSECKEPYFTSKKHEYHYCPNCGAKMDETEVFY